jgi:transcription initiation factor TFIID subunit 3
MSNPEFFHAALRPAVIHILRAAGFNGTKASVLDALTDIAARYIMLLAQKTATNAFHTHNDIEPNITDVRLAMQQCGILVPTLTASEETWRELLRKPLHEYPERNGLRAKERMRRDAEDTKDVRDFIDWVRGDTYKEIKRIAGLAPPQNFTDTADLDAAEMEDYLTSMWLAAAALVHMRLGC